MGKKVKEYSSTENQESSVDITDQLFIIDGEYAGAVEDSIEDINARLATLDDDVVNDK